MACSPGTKISPHEGEWIRTYLLHLRIKGYYAPQGFLTLVDSNSDSDSDLIYFSLGLTSIAISSESDWNRNWSRAVWKSHKTTLYRQLDKRKLPKKYDKDWAFLFSFAYSYVLSIVILYDDTIKKSTEWYYKLSFWTKIPLHDLFRNMNMYHFWTIVK